MATTIVPSLGSAPLYTQQGVGASPGYAAIDRRRASMIGLQEGVLDSTSYMVTQRAAGGAGMFVDIAANVTDALGSGVAAVVAGDSVVAQGLYPVPPHSAIITEAIAVAHATLPRVDLVVLEVLDNIHDSSGSNLARVRVITGTAVSGANLDANRASSAAALPSSCLLLADVLVAGAATTITNATIRDRRKWARGAYCRIVRNANAAAGNDYTTTSTNIALIDGTNLAPRIECSGAPLRVRLMCTIDTVAGMIYFSPQVDGAGVDGMTSVGVDPLSKSFAHSSSLNAVPAFEWVIVPSAGSHVIAPGWCCPSDTGTVYASAGRPVVWQVEEILRQNTRNNSVTTG